MVRASLLSVLPVRILPGAKKKRFALSKTKFTAESQNAKRCCFFGSFREYLLVIMLALFFACDRCGCQIRMPPISKMGRSRYWKQDGRIQETCKSL